jgi:hypothetical protein
VSRVDEDLSRVCGLTIIYPVVTSGDPNRSANDVCEAVLVLIEVVSPGVSHAEAFVYLTEVHVDVGGFGWEEV